MRIEEVDGGWKSGTVKTGKSKAWPVTMIVSGSLLALGPAWGLLGTVIGMIRAFHTLAQSSTATQSQLTVNITSVLWATGAGLIIMPFGILLLVGGIVWLKKMKKSPQTP